MTLPGGTVSFGTLDVPALSSWYSFYMMHQHYWERTYWPFWWWLNLVAFVAF